MAFLDVSLLNSLAHLVLEVRTRGNAVLVLAGSRDAFSLQAGACNKENRLFPWRNGDHKQREHERLGHIPLPKYENFMLQFR